VRAQAERDHLQTEKIVEQQKLLEMNHKFLEAQNKS